MIDIYEKYEIKPESSLETIQKELRKRSNEWTSKLNIAPDEDRRSKARVSINELSEARNKYFVNESAKNDYDRKLAEYKTQQERHKQKTDEINSAESIDVDALIAKAREACVEENYSDAVRVFEKLCNEDEENMVYRKWLLKAYYRQYDRQSERQNEFALNEAVKVLAYLKSKVDFDYDLNLYAGRVSDAQGNWEGAADYYRKAISTIGDELRSNTNEYSASISLANIYQEHDYFEDAIQLNSNMLSKITDDDAFYYREGIKINLSNCYIGKLWQESGKYSDGNLCFTSKEQVKNAQQTIEAVKNLYPEHESIGEVEKAINYAMKYRFTFSIQLAVFAAIVSYLVFHYLSHKWGIIYYLSDAFYVLFSRTRQYVVNGGDKSNKEIAAAMALILMLGIAIWLLISKFCGFIWGSFWDFLRSFFSTLDSL